MKLKDLKKAILLVPALAITFGAFGQSKVAQSTASSAAPAHFPKQKTEANLQSWAKQYPREASEHNEVLLQKMMKLNLSVPKEQQQYNEMKKEYKTISQAADATEKTPGTK
jgi:uncharacterized protein HemX